jgi:pyruvate,water dikinase
VKQLPTASEAEELEPGEILVAPGTDPSWTPLFVSAEAVVVDCGRR